MLYMMTTIFNSDAKENTHSNNSSENDIYNGHECSWIDNHAIEHTRCESVVTRFYWNFRRSKYKCWITCLY